MVHLADGPVTTKTNESTPSLRHSPGYSSPEYSTPSDTAGSSSEPHHSIPLTSLQDGGNSAEIPVVDGYQGVRLEKEALLMENPVQSCKEGDTVDSINEFFAISANSDSHSTSVLHPSSTLPRQVNEGSFAHAKSDADLWAWLTSESSDLNVQDAYLSGDLQSNGQFASSQAAPSSFYDPNTDFLGETGVNMIPTGFETTVSFAPLIINDTISDQQPIPDQGDESADALASRINAAAWNTFLHQNGIPDINSGMDWESIYQTR